jgi:hypothetical protein
MFISGRLLTGRNEINISSFLVTTKQILEKYAPNKMHPSFLPLLKQTDGNGTKAVIGLSIYNVCTFTYIQQKSSVGYLDSAEFNSTSFSKIWPSCSQNSPSVYLIYAA